MQLVTWNIRGLNKPHKQRELKLFMKENNIRILALLKHKIKKDLAGKVIQKVAPRWKYEGNYEMTEKGGIWILWDCQYVECEVVSKTDQYIHSKVKIKSSGLQFSFVAIYGLHTINDRVQMWEE